MKFWKDPSFWIIVVVIVASVVFVNIAAQIGKGLIIL